MENASKALIIAGAVLLSILIIAIGIFIFNGANSTITDSMTSMSTQEIEAFNNQFLSYDGKQSGSNVKALIGRLVANANTYKDETGKLPTFVATKVNADNQGNTATRPASANNITTYVTALSDIRNKVENKHEFTVSITFATSGIIDTITVTY